MFLEGGKVKNSQIVGIAQIFVTIYLLTDIT